MRISEHQKKVVAEIRINHGDDLTAFDRLLQEFCNNQFPHVDYGNITVDLVGSYTYDTCVELTVEIYV